MIRLALAMLAAFSVPLCVVAQPTIPTHQIQESTVLAMVPGPTGLVTFTASYVAHGSLGFAIGVGTYVLDPATGQLSNGQTNWMSMDGSTYSVDWSGAAVSLTGFAGTYTVTGLTGRYVGGSGAGTWTSKRLPSGTGSRIETWGTWTR